MLPKQAVITALQGGKPERVPVGTFLGGSWPIHKVGMTLEELIGDPEKTAQIFYEVNEQLDADFLTIGTGSTALIIKALGGEIKFSQLGAPEIVSELIKVESDLDRLSAESILNDPAIIWIGDSARHLFTLCGEHRFIFLSGRAPFTLASQMFGLENLCRCLYKNSALAHRILAFATSVSTAFYKSILEQGFVHGAMIADPSSSGDLISRKHFEEFALPYLRRVVKEVKELGAPVLLHICGDIHDRLDLIPTSGVDCLSLDSKVSLASARKILANRICLGGNVNPVEILHFGTEEEVQRAAADCLQAAAGDGGFILMPGCDLASQVPITNILALIEAGHNWHDQL